VTVQEKLLETLAKLDSKGELNNLTDDYIQSFKNTIENLKQLLQRKNAQNGSLHSKVILIKKYSREMKTNYAKLLNKNGQALPTHLKDEPLVVEEENDDQNENL
jgi:glutaredoxin 2